MFDARLERAMASVVTDETYLAYAGFDIVDRATTYTVTEDGRAFVAFSGRESYRNEDGTTDVTVLRQFQVWLRETTSGWRVTRFESLPSEDEGMG